MGSISRLSGELPDLILKYGSMGYSHGHRHARDLDSYDRIMYLLAIIHYVHGDGKAQFLQKACYVYLKDTRLHPAKSQQHLEGILT